MCVGFLRGVGLLGADHVRRASDHLLPRLAEQRFQIEPPSPFRQQGQEQDGVKVLSSLATKSLKHAEANADTRRYLRQSACRSAFISDSDQPNEDTTGVKHVPQLFPQVKSASVPGGATHLPDLFDQVVG